MKQRGMMILPVGWGLVFGLGCSWQSGDVSNVSNVSDGTADDAGVIYAVAEAARTNGGRSAWADRPLAERIGPLNLSKRAFAVVLSQDNKILLSHRTESRSCEGWQLPGGLRTGYESAEANVLREVREEVGVSMDNLATEWFYVDERVGTAYFRFRYAGTSADGFEIKDPDADFGLPFSDKSAWFALDSERAKCLIDLQENRYKLGHKHVQEFFGLVP